MDPTENDIYVGVNARGWHIVINNWTQADYDALVAEKYDYLIIGKEVGELGTPHLQCCLYKESKVGFNGLKKRNPRAYLKPIYASVEANTKYCSKGGDFVVFGVPPKQGKRNDLEEVKKILKETGKVEKVVESASNYQQIRMAECIVKYIEPKRTWKPYVVWVYGESGRGKTRLAYEKTKDPYRKSNSTAQWWDGYDGHEDVIIDDIKEAEMKIYLQLLELLDRYETRVQTKGGTRQFLAKKIYCTSIWHPSYLFGSFNEAQEILRRIDEIIEL